MATPLRRRLRRDVLGWGVVAGVAAAVALGLTGGGWWAGLVLGVLVLAACLLLSLLGASPRGTRTPRPPSGSRPDDSHDGSGDGSGGGSAP